MLLAIDVGNTNIVFALIEEEDIHFRWRIATNTKRTSDEYAVWLNQLLQLNNLSFADIDDVIMASVVPGVMRNLASFTRKYCHKEPLITGQPPVEYGMKVDLPDPGAVGADRIVNAIAAYAAWESDLIIIDFGTATTFDIVDFNGSYKGGVIAPGINLSLEALVTAAAKLPRIVITEPKPGDKVIGKTTEDAMHSGVFWGYVSMIEGMTSRLTEEIGRPVKVIATGGLAPLFDGPTDIFDEVVSDLTLKGLNILYKRIGK
ncbi:type III pantothenate kinase [Sphingorhabdus sp. Alg239-R122]|uniref:type III pantothenate kinase n=1 Tax=Sphingorhabdus sp. Alg239-R122 TaxID=2305989 RepID=UPI0013D9E023|nr:type III pantothenate kinase [Sphingorhabdus sp. Alg239-R122]